MWGGKSGLDCGEGFRLAEIPLSGGAVAQLGERLNGIQEVDGSIPFSSTNKIKGFSLSVQRMMFHQLAYS